jgi:hypothetical protein
VFLLYNGKTITNTWSNSMPSPRIEAARQGQRKYTGKPCPKCGCTERYVINAACVDCTKGTSKAAQEVIKQHLQEAAKAGA